MAPRSGGFAVGTHGLAAVVFQVASVGPAVALSKWVMRTLLLALPLMFLAACAMEDEGAEFFDTECADDCDVAVAKDTFYRVCYPGEGEPVCLTSYFVKPEPSSLKYPAGAPNNAALPAGNYRDAVAFLDLEEVYAEHGQEVKISPNFRLDEIASGWRCKDPGTGDALYTRLGCRWAVVQVHALEKLQQLRNALGPVEVVSGFRAPGYNAYGGGSGRATYSRHMWGDAIDFKPHSVSLTVAKKKCQELGAYYINLYSTHIHCDWRHLEVDKRFFGNHLAPQVAKNGTPTHEEEESPYSASIVSNGGVLVVDHHGFDEGEPLIEWHAFGHDGEVIATHHGGVFGPPNGAVSVQAIVAGWLQTRIEL